MNFVLYRNCKLTRHNMAEASPKRLRRRRLSESASNFVEKYLLTAVVTVRETRRRELTGNIFHIHAPHSDEAFRDIEQLLTNISTSGGSDLLWHFEIWFPYPIELRKKDALVLRLLANSALPDYHVGPLRAATPKEEKWNNFTSWRNTQDMILRLLQDAVVDILTDLMRQRLAEEYLIGETTRPLPNAVVTTIIQPYVAYRRRRRRQSAPAKRRRSLSNCALGLICSVAELDAFVAKIGWHD